MKFVVALLLVLAASCAVEGVIRRHHHRHHHVPVGDAAVQAKETFLKLVNAKIADYFRDTVVKYVENSPAASIDSIDNYVAVTATMGGAALFSKPEDARDSWKTWTSAFEVKVANEESYKTVANNAVTGILDAITASLPSNAADAKRFWELTSINSANFAREIESHIKSQAGLLKHSPANVKRLIDVPQTQTAIQNGPICGTQLEVIDKFPGAKIKEKKASMNPNQIQSYRTMLLKLASPLITHALDHLLAKVRSEAAALNMRANGAAVPVTKDRKLKKDSGFFGRLNCNALNTRAVTNQIDFEKHLIYKDALWQVANKAPAPASASATSTVRPKSTGKF